MRVAPPVELTEDQERALQQWARGRSLPARQVERARIVLLAAAGKQDLEIAAEIGISNQKAARWRRRFLQLGLAGLEKDAPRPGRTPTITPAKVQEVVRKTTQERPSNATHWSTRTMAEAAGLSEKSVRRIWHGHGLKPHLSRTFKVSNDPEFAEKLEAIIGLYLNPPEHAIVLCADEKSQIQALDRTQPGLPLKKGRCGTMTHDYKRNGTATLFAAMSTAGWHRDQHVRRPAPSPGMAEVSTRDRRPDAARQKPAPDRRQLRHAQASEGAAVVGATSALSHALHPDQ
jgi:transposase